jgi:hypothetical protein
MIEKIFIVPHTHTDLGYTADVSTVLARQCGILSSVLDLCAEGTDPWDGDSYRWTIESAVILRHWWETASDGDRERAVALLRSGRWQLAGFETQLLTELPGPEELKASVSWACRMGREYGFPIRGLILDDIGGYARGLPSAVSPEGIEYLVAGIGGYRVFLPTAGLPPLFTWEAPDGARILIWQLGVSEELDPRIWESLPAQYGFGNSYVIFPVRDIFSDQERDDDPEKLKFKVNTMDEAYRRLERDLASRGYPYRYLMLQAAGDNRGLDLEMPRWVDLWNENIDRPKICIATADEFFDAMFAEYGKDGFPVLKGDIHDPWNDHSTTNPKAFGEYRSNNRTIHLLKAVGKGDSAIEERLCAALRWQLWFSDHTFGLSMWDGDHCIALDESAPSDPKMQKWVDSWKDKTSYPRRAAKILREAEAVLRSGQEAMVFVPSRQPTSVISCLPPGSRPDRQDAAAVQDGPDCTWVQWNDLSISRPGRLVATAPATGSVAPEGVPTTLDSNSWQVQFDPDTGRLIEAASRRTSRNILGDGPEAHLGDVLVFDVDDMDERKVFGAMLHRATLTCQPVEWSGCKTTAEGELVREIERLGVIRCPQGDQKLQQRWRLYRGSDVLEIDTLWEKLPRVRREACYFALPLRFENPDVLIDQGLTTAHVGQDELLGCFRDQYSVQQWVAVKDASGGLLISPLEAGMVEVDEIRFQEFRREPIRPQTGSLFFLLSNNCWPTNCPRWQPGPLRFRFRLKLLSADVSIEDLSLRGSGLALGALVTGCRGDSMAW